MTESDIAPLRKALFGTSAPLTVTDLKVGNSGEIILSGEDGSVYLILRSYTVSGKVHEPDGDAATLYEIALTKHGDAWVVTSWTGIIGKVK